MVKTYIEVWPLNMWAVLKEARSKTFRLVHPVAIYFTRMYIWTNGQVNLSYIAFTIVMVKEKMRGGVTMWVSLNKAAEDFDLFTRRPLISRGWTYEQANYIILSLPENTTHKEVSPS